MDPDKIGKFILELRKEKNLSQYQLADMIPISRQAVSKWERGKTTPDSLTLMKLSEIFGVTINELLTGGRQLDNSIEGLEETALSILDQSNKKSKKIKTILVASTSIILVLLLSFLSYYFINSYNTINVYKVAGDNGKFTSVDGIFMTTKEKYYLKLGKFKYKDDIKIDNIKLYYKQGNKNILIAEDVDIDNLTIMDSYGYKGKIKNDDIKTIINNTYIEIKYNEKEKSILKLTFKKDFMNDSMFFKKVKKETINIKDNDKEKITVKVEDTKTEEIKEEKPEEKKEEVKETQPVVSEPAPTPTPAQTQTQPTPQPQPQPTIEQPKEVEITPELVINKIKENCTLDLDSYMCDYDNYNVIIMYSESMNKISIFKGSLNIDYNLNNGKYICQASDCKSEYENIIKDYLLK